ncbi:hypothetical protein RND81_04G091600 [Saponaria officinalis]|uniref:Pectinesterase inhibitor domain-containing protein n=1 Tax=Saponaria officinalis TaxID=3572 RepID=A0AAW1LMF5_SAPOF
MKHSFAFYITLIFTLLLISPITQCNGSTRKLSESFLSLTCRKASDFGFCAYTLGSDPRGKTTDVDGLAQIALDKLAAQVKGTISYLQRQDSADPVVGSCLQFYRTADSKVYPSAVGSLNNKAYGAAKQATRAVMNHGHGCQVRVDQSPSPKWQMLTSMNKVVHDLSQLSSDLIGLKG